MDRTDLLLLTSLLFAAACDDKESADPDGDGYISDDCDNNDAAINPGNSGQSCSYDPTEGRSACMINL